MRLHTRFALESLAFCHFGLHTLGILAIERLCDDRYARHNISFFFGDDDSSSNGRPRAQVTPDATHYAHLLPNVPTVPPHA